MHQYKCNNEIIQLNSNTRAYYHVQGFHLGAVVDNGVCWRANRKDERVAATI